MSDDLKKKLAKAADDLARWKDRNPVISNIERDATKKLEDIVREFRAKIVEKKP